MRLVDHPPGSVPIRRLVPRVMVTGRSVLSLRVKHGMPSTVRLLLDAPGVGQHESRPAHQADEIEIAERLDEDDALARASTLRRRRAGSSARRGGARTRGWTGNTIGMCRARLCSAPISAPSVRGSSTLAGRCKVSTAYGVGRARARAGRTRVTPPTAAGDASSASIITLPTKWIRSAATPSRSRFSRPALLGDEEQRPRWRRSATRLISSGIVAVEAAKTCLDVGDAGCRASPP